MKRFTFYLLVITAAGCSSAPSSEPPIASQPDASTPTVSSLPTVSPLPADPVKLLAEAKAYAFNSEPEKAISRLERIPATSAQYKEAQSILAKLKKGSEVAPPDASAKSKDYTAPGATTTPGSITAEPDNPLARSDLYVADLKNAPIEYKLNFLDTGEPMRGNDVNAARIRYLLGFVSQRTGDNKGHIADQTARCTVVLKQKYGKSVTNLRFLEEVNSYFLAGGPKDNYSDLSVMMVITLGK